MKKTLLTLLAICSLMTTVGTATAAGGKKGTAAPTITVTEFFSYGCPHCAKFEDVLEPWIQKLPKDVKVDRIPVSDRFPSEFSEMAKLYYALQIHKQLTPQLHQDIFRAIHDEGQRLKLWNKDVLTKWLDSKGIDGAKIASEMDGFAVDTQIRAADGSARTHQVGSVPALFINGRSTANSGAKSFEDLLKVADGMIAQERRR